MSLLSFLPRLTSWGSEHRQKFLQSEQEESENSHEAADQKNNELFGYQMKFEIARSPRQERKIRKQISYWSDEEAVAIRPSRFGTKYLNYSSLSFQCFRYPATSIYRNEQKDRFTTTWRPRTTFGFKNDFDLEKYLRTNKERQQR